MRLVQWMLLGGAVATGAVAGAQAKPANKVWPWSDKTLSADQRADLVLRVLTVDEKIQLLHGTGDPHIGPKDPQAEQENGGSGWVPGFPKYGIPGIQMNDSAVGIAYSAGRGRYATWLPAAVGLAATWEPEAAQRYGTVIGQELRDQGFNMTLSGGVNLTREPRDGRTFEYMGGDPLLAGTMVGNLIKGVAGTHVIGDIKHYAVNDQESGRHAVSSEISERAMRETDLRAFKIGIDIGQPGAVMCAYNRVNGDYACENSFLLQKVLKDEWGFKGFVVSDWLATHSTVKASHAGLDQEEPGNFFFGPGMKRAVLSGTVSRAELDEHAHRVLRAMFAAGVVDDPPKRQVPDALGHAATARALATKSFVLLRNEGSVLPLDATRPLRLAVIGRNADKGMISGGGSAQVDPPGGNAIGDIPEKERKAEWQKAVWFRDAPLAAVKEAAPNATVVFADGSDVKAAAKVAADADAVLLYAYQWQAEGVDLPTLALPDGQDALIEAVAAVNKRSVVILETGGPVLMPWRDKVAGVLATWFSGLEGSRAVADVVFGKIAPSGKLPLTFPMKDADLPHPALVEPPKASQEDWHDADAMSLRLLRGLPSFPTRYDEGLQVDYAWYDAQHKPVLYPFGFGLSYTTFAYEDIKVQRDGEAWDVEFAVRNTGTRAGEEIAQVYAALPASEGEPPKRLVGWQKIELAPGEVKPVKLHIAPERLQVWDELKRVWMVPPGVVLMAGPNSRELPLRFD